ncbi:hypothetical protein PVAND_000398 [Polypedilum vanderplanki]|uniref:BZIP domain-containing protein n=1 Tax=Polypedilum vanderplanki TaxID=319348 RepID=A0A9J6BKT8_POLVA|nr:hypothetical protein PVAND_000398 [Polypedilum vanderplanki]
MSSTKSRRTASLKSLEDDEISYSGSNGTYFDSEDDTEYKPTIKRFRNVCDGKKSESATKTIQRKPTRIPDSKVTNRNALLARENRKRKKEMMETLEQACTDLETENKRLLKMMKFKDAREKKLLKEIQYLKSVIFNRTEIVSVLKSLPQFSAKPDVSKTKSVEKMKIEEEEEENSDGFTSKASSVTLSCSDDIENDMHLDVATEWDEILQNPFSSVTNFTDIPKLDDMGILSPASSPLSEISTEHNYSNLDEEEHLLEPNSGDNDSPGVCIHVRRGKVSLEFCSAKKVVGWSKENSVS